MEILNVLIIFFLLSTVIKIAVDNVAEVLKPFLDIRKYKLVIALFITLFGVWGLNIGVLNKLNIPSEVSRSWFHYFDLILTALFLTAGAQAIHRLNNAWKNYRKSGENNGEDE